MFLLPAFLVLLGYFAAYPMICLAADWIHFGGGWGRNNCRT